MKYIMLLVLFLSLGGCSGGSSKDNITNLLKEWVGKTILYPSNCYFTVYGKDTVKHSMWDAQYKIVNYVDSMGCLSCKLNLSKWKVFIVELDSIYTGKTTTALFLSSKRRKEILHLLKRENFDYPICIDEADSFNKLNHFPTEPAYQTFLLDEDDKVLAIGNPINNPKVKELYLKIIQGEKVAQEKETEVINTKVAIDKTSISLGRFDWQKEQKVTFTLKNTGNKPLVVQDINTSCGCTSVSYSKEPVQPGRELNLEVTYKAEHPEHFNKTLTVYCNTESSPLILKIMGDAE